ncbi:LCP family protein [Anaerocolumna xylanovorans]|uniref:Transcriptional attenuator, LytR family n=1 Tax=Anaerocolumna xylanovorans DSM 12503 TaxID=1121345 RepID=A0A1M7YAF2_9FIRM|nr:LCP family protein [Anaerocolumna xylanovorans]SHO49587.1 transcriptional attenuator, LytR family [Anaerocolumna xylanovorans DSM 12503]
MEKISGRKGKRYTKIIGIILAVFVFAALCIFLLAHSYISKLNKTPALSKDVVKEENAVTDIPKEDNGKKEDSLAGSSADSSAKQIASAQEAIRKNMVDKSTPVLSDKNVFNILLIGTDNRVKGENSRSDAMILVSINKKDKSIAATSLLRDIYLQIPGKNNNRLNAACAYGGPALLMDTIEQNFKVSVDRYASVDFYVFMDIIDAVGGVTVEVTGEEISVINDYIAELNKLRGEQEKSDYLTEPGELKLNGKQALAYARNRYIGTDFERTARQRRVLNEAFQKIKKLNLIQLNSLLNKVLPQVTTNLTEGEIFSMILSLPKYAGYDIRQCHIPVDNSYEFMRIRGMDVITLDFDKNIKALKEQIYPDRNIQG